MKKKILSMLLSMVLTVACFTGCGSNPSSGGETGGAASTEIPKNPEDMYTVTMAVIGNDQEDMDLVEAEMNKILAEKVGAQIDVITLGWGVYQQQLQLMLSGAEKLDLVPIMYNNVSTYVNSGQVLDMSDLIDQYGVNMKAALGEDILKIANMNGYVYGVPVEKEWYADSCLVMRKDILDKYNLDVSILRLVVEVSAAHSRAEVAGIILHIIHGIENVRFKHCYRNVHYLVFASIIARGCCCSRDP